MIFLIIVIILLVLYFVFKDKLDQSRKNSISQINEQINSIKENAKDLFNKDKATEILSKASESVNEMLMTVRPSGQKIYSFADGLNIPNNVMELLWIKGGPLNNYTDDEIKEQCINGIRFSTYFQTEPSLIDISLSIDDNINELDYMEDIGYYPSYQGLSPKQRYIYLSWLQDVSKPVAMGYVFIFYYGLERHLMFGKYREAVIMINYLQKFHNNKSFYSYSTDAMLIGILKHNDFDMLSSINYENASNSVYALVKGTLNKKFSAEDIIRLHKVFGFTNNRYIKSQYNDFLNKLNEKLLEKYKYEYYPLPSNTISDCTGNQLLVVANYSLMHQDRFASAPDLSTNKVLCDEIFSLLSEVHEEIKSDNRNKRKKNPSNLTKISDVNEAPISANKVDDKQTNTNDIKIRSEQKISEKFILPSKVPTIESELSYGELKMLHSFAPIHKKAYDLPNYLLDFSDDVKSIINKGYFTDDVDIPEFLKCKVGIAQLREFMTLQSLQPKGRKDKLIQDTIDNVDPNIIIDYFDIRDYMGLSQKGKDSINKYPYEFLKEMEFNTYANSFSENYSSENLKKYPDFVLEEIEMLKPYEKYELCIKNFILTEVGDFHPSVILDIKRNKLPEIFKLLYNVDIPNSIFTYTKQYFHSFYELKRAKDLAEFHPYYEICDMKDKRACKYCKSFRKKKLLYSEAVIGVNYPPFNDCQNEVCRCSADPIFD